MTKRSSSTNSNITAQDVAQWMLRELEGAGGVLYQTDAAAQIADLFGESFVYQNASGNDCIRKDVLAAFRKLSGDSVVWARRERNWRKRERGDEPSRQQN